MQSEEKNINFIKDKIEEISKDKIVTITRLKYEFNNRGFAVTAYARAYKVDKSIVTKILKGGLNGTKINGSGDTRKVIVQLKKDKVWIGRLPWEVK